MTDYHILFREPLGKLFGLSEGESIFLRFLCRNFHMLSLKDSVFLDTDGFFMCTIAYIEQCTGFGHDKQKRLFSLLRKGGWIETDKGGIHRYVRINFEKIKARLDQEYLSDTPVEAPVEEITKETTKKKTSRSYQNVTVTEKRKKRSAKLYQLAALFMNNDNKKVASQWYDATPSYIRKDNSEKKGIEAHIVVPTQALAQTECASDSVFVLENATAFDNKTKKVKNKIKEDTYTEKQVEKTTTPVESDTVVQVNKETDNGRSLRSLPENTPVQEETRSLRSLDEQNNTSPETHSLRSFVVDAAPNKAKSKSGVGSLRSPTPMKPTTFLKKHQTFGHKMADRIYKVVHRRLLRSVKLGQWATALNHLVEQIAFYDKLDLKSAKRYVREVIEDHLANLDDPYQPRRFSGLEIAKNFPKLEDAKKRREFHQQQDKRQEQSTSTPRTKALPVQINGPDFIPGYIDTFFDHETYHYLLKFVNKKTGQSFTCRISADIDYEEVTGYHYTARKLYKHRRKLGLTSSYLKSVFPFLKRN